jgi:hypothetical protein
MDMKDVMSVEKDMTQKKHTLVMENQTGCGEMNEFIANAYLTPFQSWALLIFIGYIIWRFVR